MLSTTLVDHFVKLGTGNRWETHINLVSTVDHFHTRLSVTEHFIWL